MKKSEAVVLIANQLLALAPEHYNQMSSYSRRGDAEAILNALLDKGFKAPSYDAHPETGKPIPYSKGISLTLHYFEPED